MSISFCRNASETRARVYRDVTIYRNAPEPAAPVYRLFRCDLPVHAPMPHMVYRHSMNRVCTNDPDLNGDFHSDIRRRSEDEVERSRSRLDVSLLNRLSRNLLGHIGSFLVRECSLRIRTLQGLTIMVRLPHRFISVRTVKLAFTKHPWTSFVKQIMFLPADSCRSSRFRWLMCNNDNIDDYWCPKPGEDPDVMHITLVYRMQGLPRTALACRARAGTRTNVKRIRVEARSCVNMKCAGNKRERDDSDEDYSNDDDSDVEF